MSFQKSSKFADFSAATKNSKFNADGVLLCLQGILGWERLHQPQPFKGILSFLFCLTKKETPRSSTEPVYRQVEVKKSRL